MRTWDAEQILAIRENKLLAAVYEKAVPALARKAWVKPGVRLLPGGKPASFYASELRRTFGTSKGTVRTTDVLGDYVTFTPEKVVAHYASGPAADPARLRYLPLLKLALEDPYEIWLETYRVEGRLVWRKKYVYLYRDDQNRQFLTIVETGRGDGVLITSFPARKEYIKKRRGGLLLHRRK